MSGTPFEYRHRYLLHTMLYILGFVAPWDRLWHVDPAGANAHAWGILAADLAQFVGLDIAVAFKLLLVLAIACAVAGALLRTWGSSLLGADVVESSTLHTASRARTVGIIEDGPYRYVRNPLYLGTIMHTLALASIMPGSGAVLIVIAIPLYQLRLISVEERFLRSSLGSTYDAYCERVPRLLPALRPRIAAVPLSRHWGQAILGEIYMWGVAASFAVAGWWYNSILLIQCVVVSFGVSLLARAVSPRRGKE